jgi:hypothetical protein
VGTVKGDTASRKMILRKVKDRGYYLWLGFGHIHGASTSESHDGLRRTE